MQVKPGAQSSSLHLALRKCLIMLPSFLITFFLTPVQDNRRKPGAEKQGQGWGSLARSWVQFPAL